MFVKGALGVAANKVVVRVKRIGGGFGGKEARNCIITLPAVVAAEKYITIILRIHLICILKSVV